MNSNESIVIKRDSLKYVFSQIYNLSSDQILTDAEVENIYARLYPYTQVYDDVRLRHVKTIHEQILQQTNNTNSNSATNVGVYSLISEPQKVPTNIETPLELNKPDSSNDNLLGHIEFVEQDKKCPRCNGNLVLRTATKGVHVGNHFYGCTNYPRCKFIMNITKES